MWNPIALCKFDQWSDQRQPSISFAIVIFNLIVQTYVILQPNLLSNKYLPSRGMLWSMEQRGPQKVYLSVQNFIFRFSTQYLFPFSFQMIFITEMAGALWIFQLANKCNRYLAINVKHFSHWTAHKTHWLAQNPWSSFFLPKEKLLLCYEVKISEDNVKIFTWSWESFTENESCPRILPFYIFRFGVHFQNFI